MTDNRFSTWIRTASSAAPYRQALEALDGVEDLSLRASLIEHVAQAARLKWLQVRGTSAAT
jgi:hypothetical protein